MHQGVAAQAWVEYGRKCSIDRDAILRGHRLQAGYAIEFQKSYNGRLYSQSLTLSGQFELNEIFFYLGKFYFNYLQ